KRFDSLVHSIAHMSAGIFAALMVCPPEFQFMLAGAMSALLPDFDVELGLPHRTQSHSLLPPVVLYLFYATEKEPLLLAVIAGYISHLVVDLLHGNGIMLFFPIRTFVSISNIEPRIIAVVAVLLAGLFAFRPLPEPPIVKAFATPFQIYPSATPTNWKGYHVHITIYSPTPSTTPTPWLDGYRQIFFGTFTPTPTPLALQKNFLTTIATYNP
ncbi:MAG: metal-dependent hydrolase, partial [Anaerolineales bacterium]